MRAEIESAFGSVESPLLRRSPASVVAETAAPAAGGPGFTPKPTLGKQGRRSMDTLREDALRSTTVARARPAPGPRLRLGGSNVARIALLVVALSAGGLAAYLATAGISVAPPPAAAPAPEAVTTVVPEARLRVLVARGEIGMGQRLTPENVEWTDWPEGSVRSEYITSVTVPDAPVFMAGSVARFEFFPGEPIREAKLAKPGDGYLSAVLDSGKRGVSVSVSAESASGGFIVPNDRVDVVLTRAAVSGAGQHSDTILENVRVLAVNTRLGERGATGELEDPTDPEADIFREQAIATLELDPAQAEIIINATAAGRLALVLRPMTDAADPAPETQSAANRAIRMTSPFWAEGVGSLASAAVR